MASRATQYRADQQRHAGKKARRPGASKPGIAPKKRARAKPRLEDSAAYALEAVPSGGRPSRRSTRKTANRAKPSSTLDRVESMRKGSPTARFRKSQARGSRARGSRRGP